MYSAFRIDLKILWNHKSYRICIDSHRMDGRSLIQGMSSPSKDDLWALLYTIGDSIKDRVNDIKTGDGQMSRTRQRGRLWKLFERECQNIPECHIWNNSRFSQPNVGRYVDNFATQLKGFATLQPTQMGK